MQQRVHLQPRKFLIVKAFIGAFNKKALEGASLGTVKLRKGSLTAMESTSAAEAGLGFRPAHIACLSCLGPGLDTVDGAH